MSSAPPENPDEPGEDDGAGVSAAAASASAVRPGRPAAAAAIWAWESAETVAVDFDQLARRKRLRGVIQGLTAAAVGAAMLALDVRTPAFIVFGIASVVAISALVAPTSLYAGIERGFAALGRLTGVILGWVLLTPVFYLFFAPFGLLLRRGRRDRLQRVLDPEAESYWEPHEGMRTASDSYLRQF